MTFVISTKESFFSDFIGLNRDDQKRATKAMKELKISPDEQRGDTVKKLVNHDRLWRYRFGDYRMVYAVYPQRRLVQLLAVGPRSEVYERIHYQPDDPGHYDYSSVLEQTLNPDEETSPAWAKYLEQAEQTDTSRTLPYHLSPDQLSEWRIEERYHEYFVDCETENDLLDCGAPPEQIERVIDRIWPPKAEQIAQDPNYLVEDPDDLIRYAEGDLISFLLLLDEDQERYVDWALSGPTLVKGGPGSGKSTVALYRTWELAERAQAEGRQPRILFTTYTNSLVQFSRQLLDHLFADQGLEVEVSTVDRVMRSILVRNGEQPTFANSHQRYEALSQARASFAPDAGSDLERIMLRNAIATVRDDYVMEEFEWVLEGQRVASLDDYLQIDRTGRGYGFDERMRRAVWALYQSYRNTLSQEGVMSWGMARMRALELAKAGQGGEPWDYVLVDEAQDLTPTALSLCVVIAADPSGIFLTADASQSLYNRGFAWKNVHDQLNIVGRTRILRRNYRTTRQIAEAAADLVMGTDAADPEALDQAFVHVDPKPRLYAASDSHDQAEWIATSLREMARQLRLPLSAAAVLAPTNDLAKEAAHLLSQSGVPAEHTKGRELDLETPAVKCLTIHSAKGLEFPIVAVPYVEDGLLPRSLPDQRADDMEKHLDQQRRLLYVACTRAMRRLVVSYRHDTGSPFLESIDPEKWQQEETRPS